MDEEIGDVELDDTENQPSTSKVKMITPIDLSGVGSPAKGGWEAGIEKYVDGRKMEKIKLEFKYFSCYKKNTL